MGTSQIFCIPPRMSSRAETYADPSAPICETVAAMTLMYTAGAAGVAGGVSTAVPPAMPRAAPPVAAPNPTIRAECALARFERPRVNWVEASESVTIASAWVSACLLY